MTQRIATAALTRRSPRPPRNLRACGRHNNVFFTTPNDPNGLRPFVRERQRIQYVMTKSEFCFSRGAGSLASTVAADAVMAQPADDSATYLLTDAVYLQYKRLPTTRIYSAASGRRRLRGWACHSWEGVTALNRLRHYCSTGASKALLSSVLGHLKMMESWKRRRGVTLIFSWLSYVRVRAVLCDAMALDENRATNPPAQTSH